MKYTGSTKESTVYSQELMTVTKKKNIFKKKWVLHDKDINKPNT